jgi:hypothetical protein
VNPGYIDPDYVDVAERIRMFFEKYPDGRLQTERPWVEVVGDKAFVCCLVHAFRTPDDPTPSTGLAWEPVPGPTNFTRDSEAMNVQTSAWGRAIVAVGIPSKRIASANEVASRQQETPVALPDEAKPVTKAQHGKIGVLVKELMDAAGPDSEADWVQASREFCLTRFGKHSRAELTSQEAGQLIDWLEEQVVIAGVPFG